MLLPALSNARQKARAISCVNNMKQICLGIIMYTNDNRDTLPLADPWGSMMNNLGDYLPNKNDYNPSNKNWCLVAAGAQSLAICPSVPRNKNVKYYTTSYQAYGHPMEYLSWAARLVQNLWVCYDRSGNWQYSYTLTRMRSDAALFGEKNYMGDDEGFGGRAYTSYLFTSATADLSGFYSPAWNHNLRTNIAFVDGHVDSFRYRGNGHELVDTEDGYITK